MKILNITKSYRLKDFKFSLLIFVLALTSLGIMVIGSAKHSVQGKQMIGLLIGLVALVIVSLIDYMWILNLQWVLYGLTIAMLLAVRFFGKDVNGATRWIDFGFTTFQPSELAKILLVLFFAKFIMNHQDEMKKPLTIIQAVIFLAIPCLLIYKQPDLSTTISIAMVFCIMMYVGGLSYKFIGVVLLITVPMVVILLSIIVHSDVDVLQGYQETRILAWLQPEKYSSDEAYQQNNSIMAIGSGRLTGKGLNNNTTTSVKLYCDWSVIINCNTMSEDRDESTGHGRQDYLLRSCFADRDSEFYQHQCCNRTLSKYRNSAAVCQLWNVIPCQYVYRYRTRVKCWTTTEKI